MINATGRLTIKQNSECFAFYSLFGDSHPSTAKVIVAICSFSFHTRQKGEGKYW